MSRWKVTKALVFPYKQRIFMLLSCFFNHLLIHHQKTKMSSSTNQMDQERRRGQAPKTVLRVDDASLNIGDSQDHVHFTDGSALKRDGTWKHGNKKLTREEKAWLLKHSLTLPKEWFIISVFLLFCAPPLLRYYYFCVTIFQNIFKKSSLEDVKRFYNSAYSHL